ncbi:histidinol dehydrogenase [Blastococcus sp. Marseille-P5729]|uniref:histidinol dehydrogenase n=1 Tax=Blastococcus sp. Marseille-P5729 TaxID=2086582 RepID=UPI0018FE87AF|nr:histidinol dehydrogenase [Blastococcus sp. Marseille-P5729]
MSQILRTIDLRGQQLRTAQLRRAVPRAEIDVERAIATVEPIVEDVEARGAQAVKEITARIDGVVIDHLRVDPADIAAALENLNPDVRAGLDEAIARARKVHEDQRRAETVTELGAGATVTEKWIPVDRVGLYVPGGLAVYPSSVVMNVVPAQVAGVGSIAVASPPQREFGGKPHPTILAACALLGVDEVYGVGGAQAVAMFAYGTEENEPVDMVTGPGNIYVTAAKRMLRGLIGIDSEAGPTEIAVLADDTADAAHVAADLISQAEHDPLAGSVLVTPSEAFAGKVDVALQAQIEQTKHVERIRTALGGEQSGVVLVDDIEQGLKVVDAYAAEHLEVQTADSKGDAARVRNAGCIFVGPYSPVPLGDYCAGSNHVLPTGGCARHSSGLSVQSFLKGVHVVDYDEQALRAVATHIVNLADAEDLPAHGAAIRARFPEL